MPALSLDWHHQRWVSSLWCFTRPPLQLTSVVVCLWLFLPLVLSSASEMLLDRVEIRRLTWPLQNIPLFLPSKTPGLLLLCFGSSSICTTFMKHRAIYFAAFGWIWADSISIYTEFFQLLLFSVTSSINTSNPVPLEAMHTHAITQLHVSQMMLYALDHLHTYFILQFWYRLILFSAFQRMLLKKWSGYL